MWRGKRSAFIREEALCYASERNPSAGVTSRRTYILEDLCLEIPTCASQALSVLSAC